MASRITSAAKRLGFAIALTALTFFLAMAFLRSQRVDPVPQDYTIDYAGYSYSVYLPEEPFTASQPTEDGASTATFWAFDGNHEFVVTLTTFDPSLNAEEMRLLVERETVTGQFDSLLASEGSARTSAVVGARVIGIDGWIFDTENERDGTRERMLWLFEPRRSVSLIYRAPEGEFEPDRWERFAESLEQR